MGSRNALLAGVLIAVGASAAALPSVAAVNIDIDVAPPAARTEVIPGPRAGYVWAPGYWTWRGHRHAWVAGRWMRARHGYHWVADSWVQRGPHWHYMRGHWER